MRRGCLDAEPAQAVGRRDDDGGASQELGTTLAADCRADVDAVAQAERDRRACGQACRPEQDRSQPSSVRSALSEARTTGNPPAEVSMTTSFDFGSGANRPRSTPAGTIV